MATTLTTLYTDEAGINALMSDTGKDTRVDDDDNDALSATEQGYIDQAIQWATAKCNFFLRTRYKAECLSTSQQVYLWATILACYYLSIHRGNPPPGSFDDAKKEAIEEMKSVHDRLYDLDIAERTSGMPIMSNMCYNLGASVKKLRVQRSLSSGRSFVQRPDFPSESIAEP